MAALSTPLFTASIFRAERVVTVVRHSAISYQLLRTYNGVRLFVPDQLISLFSVLLIGYKVCLTQVKSNWY